MKLTQEQKFLVNLEVKEKLKEIFTDSQTLCAVLYTILPDVVDDIEDTADWNDCADDEIRTDDVSISLERILYNKLILEKD